MAFQKGQSGNPAGRPRGEPNKLTGDVKAMILRAAELAGDDMTSEDDEVRGGVAYLREQAKANPPAFMALLGKVLPMQVKAEVEGGLTFTVVTGVPRADDNSGD